MIYFTLDPDFCYINHYLLIFFTSSLEQHKAYPFSHVLLTSCQRTTVEEKYVKEKGPQTMYTLVVKLSTLHISCKNNPKSCLVKLATQLTLKSKGNNYKNDHTYNF